MSEAIEIEESQSWLITPEDFRELLEKWVDIGRKMQDLWVRYIRKNVNGELDFELASDKVKRIAWKAISRVFSDKEWQLRLLMEEIKRNNFWSQLAVWNFARLAMDTIRLNRMSHSIYNNFLQSIPPYYTTYPNIDPLYKK